jgi:DNA repair photolyase
MNRWGQQSTVHFDEKELKTDLGEGNFIFIGSSNDLFASMHPKEWVAKTIEKCSQYNNSYLFQTKNPKAAVPLGWVYKNLSNVTVCTTLESDISYPKEIMGCAPSTEERSWMMKLISSRIPAYVTIEPVMRFNLDHFVEMIKRCSPRQVNIGADSGNHHLPEPSRGEIEILIEQLSKFTIVKQKTNLKRLMT